MKQLIFAPLARDDLLAIGLHIGNDDPDRALSFINELEARAAKAAEQPRAYPLRTDMAPGLRSLVHGRYLILFRETQDEVRIERAQHGARDLKRAFRE